MTVFEKLVQWVAERKAARHAHIFEWDKPISPYQRQEITALLQGLKHTRKYPGKRQHKDKPAIVGSVHGAL